MIAGIDFGSKKAGTTAICIGDEEGTIFEISQSEKAKDADRFLEEYLKKHDLSSVFIDAPLSLPGVYVNMKGFNDYFYRKCDREIGAMSPMFLGGLTARAIKLKDEWIKRDVQVIEVWPTKLAEISGIEKQTYKKGMDELQNGMDILLENYSINSDQEPGSWHQFDALLAYVSGLRYLNNNSMKYGDLNEGLIYV